MSNLLRRIVIFLYSIIIIIFPIISISCSNSLNSNSGNKSTDVINYDNDDIGSLNNVEDSVLSEMSKIYKRISNSKKTGIIDTFTYSVSYGSSGSSGAYSYSYTYSFYDTGRYALYYSQSTGIGTGSNGYSLLEESGTFTLFTKNGLYYITLKNSKGTETTYRYSVSEHYLFLSKHNHVIIHTDETIEYTITYISNNGSDIEITQTHSNDGNQRLTPIIELGYSFDGYLFDGWNTSRDGKGTRYLDCELLTTTRNLILYAQWKKAYTLSFLPNNINAVGITESIKAKIGEQIELPKCGFSLYGNNFIVWNTKEDGSGTSYEAGALFQGETDLILYAKWRENFSNSVIIEEIDGQKYAYFGDFPQTVLPLDSKITINESTTKEMGGYTYFLGSDGNWYSKIIENSFFENGNTAYYYYSDGSRVSRLSQNSYRYFKVEPIKWQILTSSNNEFLLLSENILVANIEFYGGWSHSTVNSKSIKMNEWKYSNIRAFLNGTQNQSVLDGGIPTEYDNDWSGKGFLQTAFIAQTAGKIKSSYVSNAANTTIDGAFGASQAYGSDPTGDKIFLLSRSQVTDRNYGFSSNSNGGDGNLRIRKPTDFALANYSYKTGSAGSGYWWLRSPYYGDTSKVQVVDNNGSAYVSNTATSKVCGIVPALYLVSQ